MKNNQLCLNTRVEVIHYTDSGIDLINLIENIFENIS